VIASRVGINVLAFRDREACSLYIFNRHEQKNFVVRTSGGLLTLTDDCVPLDPRRAAYCD